MNVNETSTLVGFNHVNYFSSVFKDFTELPQVFMYNNIKNKKQKRLT